jgi:hypothetical protein
MATGNTTWTRQGGERRKKKEEEVTNARIWTPPPSRISTDRHAIWRFSTLAYDDIAD